VGDASWTLRLILLAIGLGVIAGVYLYGVSRKRRRNRLYRSQLPAWPPRSLRRFEDPEAGSGTNDGGDDLPEPVDEVIAVRVRKAEPLTELPVVRREQEEPGTADAATPQVPNDAEPPSKTRAKRPRKRAQQMDLGFEEKTPTDAADEAPPPAASVTPPPQPTILALFLRPSFGPAFVGPTIVRNVNAVGMRHGDLQIFHHFGAGELKTSKPLFSLANMFEPGHFDMKRIEAFQTPGVVMFLPLPAVLDGAVAFELFLNTAQRLSEGMRAQLLSDPETPLEGPAIERLRRQAAVYQART
jgi:cell division protein ZipA